MRLASITLFGCVAATLWAQDAKLKRMPEEVAIFVVQHQSDSFYIEPVVLVHYGEDQRFKTRPALDSPLPNNITKTDLDKIASSLYKPGTPLSVFAGGQKLGTATVLRSNVQDTDGCVD